MITKFDDYCIHQTVEPIAQPSQSDRNFYDRYWFNGVEADGAFIFEVGLGLYPNRHVMDAHFSVAIDGVQHSFHGSRRAPHERADTSVGPLRIEIVEPLRSVRVQVAPNQTGIECDLIFRARTAPIEEPKSMLHDDGHVILYTARFTQLGCWEGWFSVEGRKTNVVAERTRGARDKSWGVRPVGEPQAGAPGRGEPGVFWCWSPLDFGDLCTQFGTFEDRDGNPTQLSGCILPAYARMEDIPQGDDPGRRELERVRHRIQWERGTRRPARATIELEEKGGETSVIELEPIARFQVKGLGYQHPQWAHGVWKGELEIGSDSFRLADLDPLDYTNIHVHTAVRARMGARTGIGTLETLAFGRHRTSGFKEFLDGAP